MKANENLQKKLDLIAHSPGVYKFLDKNKHILYIGKGLDLYNRVNSYFRSDISDRPQIIKMMPMVEDVEIIETDNEIESLILEAALIKKNLPPYNINLKDSSSYAWIYVSTKEDLPKVKIVRTIKKGEFNKGRLFGPYPSGKAVKQIFKYIRKIFPFCNCKNEREEELYWQLGLCPGPNIGKITPQEYKVQINQLCRFLSGYIKKPIQELEKQMKGYSQKQDYEKAAVIRDRLADLKYLTQRIGVNFFDSYQSENNYIAQRDAIFRSKISKIEHFLLANYEIKVSLQRIECYDISNIQGQYSYGSMTVAINGLPTSSHYRIFKIRDISKPDDPESIKQVLTRRLKYLNSNVDESLSKKPGLLLIDGGKTQLSLLHTSTPEDIAIIGITKGRKYRRRGGKLKDEFWYVNRGTGEVKQILVPESEIFARLRDEAHRFAIKHYRKAKSKETVKSRLDSIPGVGPKRKRQLLKKFLTVSRIQKASLKEINSVIKNLALSEKIKQALGK